HEHRPMRYHFLDRDSIVRQKPLKSCLFGAVIRQIADTHRLPFAHPFNKKFAISLQTLIAKMTNPTIHRRLPHRITTVHTESQQILSFQSESHCGTIDSQRTKLTRTATSVRKLAPKGRGSHTEFVKRARTPTREVNRFDQGDARDEHTNSTHAG